jgi:hypothetical protein
MSLEIWVVDSGNGEYAHLHLALACAEHSGVGTVAVRHGG